MKYLTIIFLSFFLLASCQKTVNPIITNCDYIGTVVDYTGLDGCGFVIELDNGAKIEPLFTGSAPNLYDQMRVGISYSNADSMASICMVGQMAWITCFQNLDCYPVEIDTNWQQNYPRDIVTIKKIELDGDILKVKISYGGGCEIHDFKLMANYPWCGTPPVPPTQLILSHNSNGDNCEALITETICFDLVGLREPGINQLDFMFLATEQDSIYQEIFTYNY